MAWALRDQGKLGNVQVMIGSDIPVASGISSSAAIETLSREPNLSITLSNAR